MLKEVDAVSTPENTKKGQGWLVVGIILAVLIIDQIIKVTVKLNMGLGEQIRVTNWFYILFVENNGMAFGMEFIGKLFLSLFRLVIIAVFCWYLSKIVNKGYSNGFIAALAFVVAGAAGNLVDCLLYGQIFSASGLGAGGEASLVPFGEGYAPMLYGRVVDMFYFPLWNWPDWMPLVGGKVFFSPVFNFADSCITCSIFVLLIFYQKQVNKVLGSSDEKKVELEKDE